MKPIYYWWYHQQTTHLQLKPKAKPSTQRKTILSTISYLLMTASTMTWIGFRSVSKWMISMACLIILTAMSFFPLFLPCIIRELVSLSTMGHCAFLNLFTEYLPAVWGTYVGEWSDRANTKVPSSRQSNQ